MDLIPLMLMTVFTLEICQRTQFTVPVLNLEAVTEKNPSDVLAVESDGDPI